MATDMLLKCLICWVGIIQHHVSNIPDHWPAEICLLWCWWQVSVRITDDNIILAFILIQSITLLSLGQESYNEPKLYHNISIFQYKIRHKNIMFHNYFMTWVIAKAWGYYLIPWAIFTCIGGIPIKLNLEKIIKSQ